PPYRTRRPLHRLQQKPLRRHQRCRPHHQRHRAQPTRRTPPQPLRRQKARRHRRILPHRRPQRRPRRPNVPNLPQITPRHSKSGIPPLPAAPPPSYFVVQASRLLPPRAISAPITPHSPLKKPPEEEFHLSTFLF